jgi:ubiquinone/menaquinone biosynthesis C-methylase UbiE
MITIEKMLNSFKCKNCSSRELISKKNFLECLKCSNKYMINGGIIDFVSSNFFTQLDNIDYDDYYSVTDESSQSLFKEFKSYLKDDLKESYGNLLEIGAGTGGFTKGLLTNIKTDEAIITDVSQKMLSICNSKISSDQTLAKNVLYATYSANENIFAPDYFDCIIGSFVLHHILKYDQFFKDSYTYLKKGGHFIFAEPNVKFHRALILTFCDILQTLISEKKKYLDPDVMNLTNWIYENYYNIKYAGDEKALIEREDKHLFSRDIIRDSALSAGFSQVKIIPFGDINSIYTCLDSYLPQLNISSSFTQEVVELYDKYQNKYFSLLAQEDSTPSYIFFFSK